MRPYPPEKYTSAAVQAFLNNTGSLLCLWTEQEAKDLCQAVYFSDQGPSPQDAVECFAMAAVGSYCDGNALTTTYQQTFMDCFIFLLQSQTHHELPCHATFCSFGVMPLHQQHFKRQETDVYALFYIECYFELTMHRCCLANRQRSLRTTEWSPKRVKP